jgi:hypothetical protein
METITYLGLYDDFQQAQRVARDLRKHNVSLRDMSIVSQRDDPKTYNTRVEYFQSRETPAYLEETQERRRDFIQPVFVGAIIGIIPMALMSVFETNIFGGYWLTLAAMVGFGALAGGVMAGIIAAMAIFTRFETREDQQVQAAMYNGLSILLVRDQDDYDAQHIKAVMRDHQPIEVTEADEQAWLETGWLAEKNIEPDESSSNTIADQRYRAFNWASGAADRL